MTISIAHDLPVTHAATGLHTKLAALADVARRTDAQGAGPFGDWLRYLAENLQDHAEIVALQLDQSTDGADGTWLFGRSGLACVGAALEELSNEVRARLTAAHAGSDDARILDELLRDLEMHWWVCHRAMAA